MLTSPRTGPDAPDDPTRWAPTAPPWPHHVVVAAPHPDDEVLGVGITMRWLLAHGGAVTVVACTDGEGSHARSSAITRDELRARRRAERATAFRALGIDPPVERLALPDGGLAGHVGTLADEFAGRCSPGTTLVVPWEHDGHPDHRAVAAAGVVAARRRGATLWQVPIWGKVRRARPFGGRVHRLELGPADRAAKATAVAAFVTQLTPVGPGEHDGPVVHPGELDRMLDGVELVLR